MRAHLASIVLIAAGAAVTFAQASHPTLSGVVLENTLSGKGVYSVQVSAEPPGNPRITNSDGTFTLEFPQSRPGSPVAIRLEKRDERNGEDYIVVNDVQLNTVLPIDPTHTLTLVICRKHEREDYARLFYKLKSLEAIEQSFRSRNAALVADREKLAGELREAENAASSQREELTRKLKEKDDIVAQLQQRRLQAEAAAQSVSEVLAEGTASENLDRFRRAMRLFLEGDINAALNILDNQAISRGADAANQKIAAGQTELRQAVDAWLLEASLLITQLRFAEAESVYGLAMSKAPSSFDANFRYAQFEQALHRHDKAIAAFEQSRKVADLDGNARGVAIALTGKGNTYVDKGDYDSALPTLEAALRAYDTLAEREPAVYTPLKAAALINLGRTERRLRHLSASKQDFDRAGAILDGLANPESPSNLYLSATLLLDVGNLDKDQEHLIDAYNKYLASTASYEKLARGDPRSYRPELGQALNNLGEVELELVSTVNSATRTDLLADSERRLNAASDIRKELVTAAPQVYDPDYAQTLTNLGLLYSAEGQFAKARESLAEAKSIRSELMRNAPHVYQNDYANTVTILGAAYGEEYDRSKGADTQLLRQAIENLEEAVKIREPLARIDPNQFAVALGRSLNPLAMAYGDQKRWDDARGAFTKALEAYGRIDPKRARYPTFHTWRALGYLELKQGHTREARHAFTTSQSYSESFSEQEKVLYKHEILDVASTLVALPKED